MSEFTEVLIDGNGPKLQFFHDEKEYLIYAQTDDDGDMYAMCLAEPKLNNSQQMVPYNLISKIATEGTTNNAGGAEAFTRNVFLPSVNEYLAEQGGEIDDGTFPDTEAIIEQFNWIVEKTLSYVDGKIAMSDF